MSVQRMFVNANAGMLNVFLVLEMSVNTGLGNICQWWHWKCLPMWYGKYMPIVVWKIFSITGIRNVCLLLVWKMFANAGKGNTYKCWFK